MDYIKVQLLVGSMLSMSKKVKNMMWKKEIFEKKASGLTGPDGYQVKQQVKFFINIAYCMEKEEENFSMKLTKKEEKIC